MGTATRTDCDVKRIAGRKEFNTGKGCKEERIAKKEKLKRGKSWKIKRIAKWKILEKGRNCKDEGLLTSPAKKKKIVNFYTTQ